MPLWGVGLAGLLAFLMWLGNGPAVYAQQGGEEEHLDGREAPDGEPIGHAQQGEPTVEGMECMVRVLGRAPAGRNDFTPEEQQLIGRECFGGGARRPAGDVHREPDLAQRARRPEHPASLLGAKPAREVDTPERAIAIEPAAAGGVTHPSAAVAISGRGKRRPRPKRATTARPRRIDRRSPAEIFTHR